LTHFRHILVGLVMGAAAASPGFAQASHAVRASGAEREALKRAIEEVLGRGPLAQARVGVLVQSLEDDAVIFSKNADDLLNPASNVKLFTAAAALGRLGPEYRFETEFHTDPEARGGKAKVLYVRGKGDPSMTTERLYGVVSELLHAGLKEVGEIVVDDSWFDGQRIAPGYDQENTDRAYMAPTGAVSLNWNAVGIYVRAAEAAGQKPVVEMEPPSDYFVVEAGAITSTSRHRRFSVSSEAAGEKQKIVVRGQLPVGAGTFSVWKKIDNPPLYFGHTLRQMLGARGVKVRGKVRQGALPSSARLLYVAQSEPLDLVLKRLNKVSSNFVAEQLIKAMAAEAKGPPGTHARGIEVVEEFLAREVGLPRGSYVMKNGSGLNDTNRFSATQINRLLSFMSRRYALMPEYLSSMGIAGKDGTLRYRFEGSEAVGRLRAKTGTLENVTALSGYVVSVGGERFAFSFMVNDYPGRAGPVIKGLDAIGAAVASTGSTEGPTRAVAALMEERRRSDSLEDLKARIQTYLALGKQGDRRNIPFLRTAWRTEKDPAVKAVVAEALYQSDRQDYVAVRTLLDSFSVAPDVFGRLRLVARELEVEIPGVSSVVDLGAEGNLEALGRVVELCGAAAGDEQTRGELAEALGELARTAPEELLATLRGATSADREATTALLARGLVKTADAAHPFWGVLRKNLGNVDPEQAAFARQTEAVLSQKIAEQKAPEPHAETRPGG
jgi:serine-type D-Ala-D-Ala carboxypeptidase/endopeptidase (penicillin-binding protein 4)